MRRRSLWGLAPAALVLGAIAAPVQADNPPGLPSLPPTLGNSVLKVVPYYIHGGDIVRVSGDGFAPGKRIWLQFSCPTAFDITGLQNHNWDFVFQDNGPKANKRGQFVNFTFKAPVLKGVTQSSCTVYAPFPDGTAGYGPDIPGSYYTMPTGKQLPKCSKQICAAVSEAPTKARSGHAISIRIRPGHHLGETSWPGALATVRVTYPDGSSARRSVKLDWEGWADLTFRIPSGISGSKKATVTASFSMGKLSGRAKDQFRIGP